MNQISEEDEESSAANSLPQATPKIHHSSNKSDNSMRPSAQISRPVEPAEMKGDDGEVFFSEYSNAKARALAKRNAAANS